MGDTKRPANLTPGTYRFDDFYRQRIYGPGGYYANGNGVGVDFNTFVNQDDRLARRLGTWLDACWHKQGRPDVFNAYEIAAGDGTLCRKLLGLNLECRDTIRYTAVESNPLYQQSFPDGVTVRQQLPEEDLLGVMFANELNGQQPMRFVSHRDGRWKELFINITDKASCEWHDLQEPLPSTLEAIQGLDGSAPWIQEAANLLHNLTARFSGDVLMLDYGFRRTIEFPGKPWFVCWLGMKPVGALDLTILPDMSILLPIDQLEELFYPATVTEQATWLAGEPQPFDGFYVMEWELVNGQPK